MTIEADAKRLIDETISRFGRLDVLINNAGFAQVCAQKMKKIALG